MRPILSRVAISFRARATWSACARLSSWQGPAIIEIGKSLPNLTWPAVTKGAAEMLAFKLFSSSRGPCRAPPRGSTLFSGLEYQGCAVGDIRRHHKSSRMASRVDSAASMQCFDLRNIRDLEAHRFE